MKKLLMLVLGTAFFAMACGPEFDPYGKLLEFRVLAIKAEKPWLPPAETTLLEPLIFTDTEDTEVTYAWEWCPITQGASNAYACAFTYEELLSLIDGFVTQFLDSFETLSPEAIEEQFGVSPETVAATLEELQRALQESPEDVLLPFDLGTDSTATLRYPTQPELVELLCRAIYESADLPDFVEVADCDEGFPITIRMIANAREPGRPAGESSQIIAAKEVLLRYDSEALNNNPSINDVVAKPLCLDDDEPVLCPEDFPGFPLSAEEGSIPIFYDVLYRLQLDIPENAVETFVPKPEDDAAVCETDSDCSDDAVCTESDTTKLCATPRLESLAVSWFVQEGSTKTTRTGFIEDEIPLEETEINDWETPRQKDFDRDVMTLFFVIRDGRGGINWLTRSVRMTAE